ncbi:sigma-54-dependent transcriptional regulator [Candidatus Riflebacteria bacterium]
MKKPIFPSQPVLIVDDEELILKTLKLSLISAGINNVETCQDSRKVLPMLAKRQFKVIIMDLLMPRITGYELLRQLSSEYPHIPVIMVTAIQDIEKVIQCMKLHAFDYLIKPVEESRFITVVKRAIKLKELERENYLLKKGIRTRRLENPDAFSEIITNNENMYGLFQLIESIAKTTRPVLIVGETGVGKELVAMALHTLSKRQGPFIPVNIAGVDDTVLSDTLFGHFRGAFTGADSKREGLIKAAHQGTLFLDEIGDLKAQSQVKLLRLLQDGEFFPVGSDSPQWSDVRIIFATNQNLEKHIEDGKFRKDLFYRLSAHIIEIPPLRERTDDIPLLVDHFLEIAARAQNKKKPTPPPELNTLLSLYSFPGNIRELQNLIYDSVSRHKKGILSITSFNEILTRDKNNILQISQKIFSDKKVTLTYQEVSKFFDTPFPTIKDIKKIEEVLIEEALKRTNQNQSMAAKLLGLSRSALNVRLKNMRK